MAKGSDSERIWEAIAGARRLYEIYGYWPSLHDAVVRGVGISYAGREIAMTVDYSDLRGESVEEEIDTRITLRWTGVDRAELRLSENSLYGMEFERDGEHILTRFDDYVYGMDGFIRSETVEVTHVEPAPVLPEDADEQEVRFSFD